ncbi:RagB/SusD family nutrient uptake outer membrane protein [Nubsella zeaxanthinifaciens]|uniref:RagB/SusD family nutrient uptake outer membrane protein n=1 Tax=Nubsella zeaxanthinifaciens TaxID=392412 RepID=UPI003D051D3D
MDSNKKHIAFMSLRCAILAGVTFFTVAVTISSCKKFIEVAAPNDKLETNSVFADSTTASSAITGIYSTLMQGNTGFMANKSILPGLSSDEFQFTSIDNTRIEFNNNDIGITNSWVSGLWSELYATVYRANAVIKGVNESNGISATAKAKLIAEAKFIRAFCYFYLINYYGDVPLVISTDYQQNASLPRSPVSVIYNQIKDDLLEAKFNLAINYPTPSRGRPTSLTASAFLSRVYLFTKDYVNAEKEATSVISNSAFSLVSNLDLAFKKESSEIIWQLESVRVGVYNSYDGFLFIPSSLYIPAYVFRQDFLNSFNASDKRKVSWVKGITIGTTTYYYPYKYKVYARGINEEFEIVFRLAEQYLIRAEARCQQNNITGANSAESDLNLIRSRAGLGNTNAVDQQSMLVAIETEKRYELFAEWGTRWLDLKRWPSRITTGKTRADDILSSLKGASWQSTDIIWPIPAAQISLNGNLKQNPGY